MRNAATERPVFDAHRVVVCGGVPAWISSMQKQFTGIRFYDATPDKQALEHADAIFFQTHALGHKHYYRAINIARRFNIPVFYFEAKSLSRCALQLQSHLKEAC